MVNGLFDPATDPGDLAAQRDDPRLELGHRQRVEVLRQECREYVVGTRRGIVGFHAHQR